MPGQRKVCFNCFFGMGQEQSECPNCGYFYQTNKSQYVNALEAGSLLHGNIMIGRVLGQGGFGITYVARRMTDGKKLAVKEFFPQGMVTRQANGSSVSVFTGEKEKIFKYGEDKFLEEAKVLEKMKGFPGIIEEEAFFMENNTAYLAMEYVEGISMKSYIAQKGGRLSYADAMRILVPVMVSLDRVHRTKCVHRDVTPDNIYITKNDTIKLLDFGSARFCLGDRSQSLDVVLKAGYAPPEQYKRRGKQGPYTDVYSLAACFYAAITGYLPPDAMKRQENKESDLLLPISKAGVAVPPLLERAIRKGLSLDISVRYRSMREFYIDIQSLVPVLQKENAPQRRSEEVKPILPVPRKPEEVKPVIPVPVNPVPQERTGISQSPPDKSKKIILFVLISAIWICFLVIIAVLILT